MIQVVQTGGISLIGEWSELTRTMENPRVIQQKQVSPTEARLTFLEITGRPKVITVQYTQAIIYEPEEELARQYRSAISGIALVPAGAMPIIPQGVK